MKDTFIIRTEWSDAIFDLCPEDKATIFDNLFHYHLGNENLINLNNLTVKLVWKLIQPNLIRNIDQYDRRRETSSENGKKGGRPRKESILDKNNLNNLTEPNETLSVSVLDSVIVLDSEIDFKKNSNVEFSKNENSQPSQKEIELALELEKANETIKTLEEKQKKEKSSAKKEKEESDNKETYGEHENVKLTQVEHDKLLTQHGETIVSEILKKLSNYKLSTGKKYKSDYGAINTWVIDSVKKDLKNQVQPRFDPNFKRLDTEPTADKYKQASERVKQKMRDSITANMYATN